MSFSKTDTNGQERLAKWDNVKFVLIFLVVLGHVAKGFMGKSEGIGKVVYFIYLFHMPAFVFVSGLFSKKTVNEKRWSKIASFLVVFYFMKTLLFFVRVVFGDKPSFSLFNEYGIAWYILGMMFFMLITMAIRHYSFGIILPLSILLGCMVGYDKSVGSLLSLSRVVTFYPFFYLGYYLDSKKLACFLKRKVIIIASFGWILGVLAVIWKYYDKLKWSYEYFLKGKGSFELQFKGFPYEAFSEYAWLVRLAYYLIVFITVLAIIAVIPSVKCMFSGFGSRTLQVYVLHQTFMYIFLTVLGGSAWLASLNMKVAFIGMLFFSIALTVCLSNKLFVPFFDLLTGGKGKKDR